ncbi:phage terminase small subunit P27 family [Micromonospora chalcea]|uniref:phage terminase small subunit P27 family n=1 Tax=Micromonospora chalcea TaxID=1874 RepID=UPI0021A897C7|nr:phage terminase small subunit P27 family [Micromonospora chalcea]MCT2279017.1 phage terminase small subunit P27 family [Micromonospora chalcea]
MARTPEPPALRLLKGRGNGTDSGGRKVAEPPAFERKAPNPPTWLSKEAAAEWRRVVPDLDRMGLLKKIDRAMLSAYCETWATYVWATREVQIQGLSVEVVTVRKDGSESKRLQANPNVVIARSAGKELRAFATHFGLSPSAEGGLVKGDGEDGEENPFGGSSRAG